MALHDTMADAIYKVHPSYRLRCTLCGRTEPLSKAQMATNLRHNWPKCHGYTMRLQEADDGT